MNAIPIGTIVKLPHDRLYSHGKVIKHSGTNYLGQPILVITPFNPGERETHRPGTIIVPQNKVTPEQQ